MKGFVNKLPEVARNIFPGELAEGDLIFADDTGSILVVLEVSAVPHDPESLQLVWIDVDAEGRVSKRQTRLFRNMSNIFAAGRLGRDAP